MKNEAVPDIQWLIQNAPMLSIGVVPAGQEEIQGMKGQRSKAVSLRNSLDYHTVKEHLGSFRALEELERQLDLHVYVGALLGQSSWHNQKTDRYICEVSLKIWIVDSSNGPSAVRGIAALFGKGAHQEGVGIRWPRDPPDTEGFILYKAGKARWTANEVDNLGEECSKYKMNFDRCLDRCGIEFWNYNQAEMNEWRHSLAFLLERIPIDRVDLAEHVLEPLKARIELVKSTDYRAAISKLKLSSTFIKHIVQTIKTAVGK